MATIVLDILALARPAKIRSLNGRWGARTGNVAGADGRPLYTTGALEVLTVTTRAGKTWTDTYYCEASGDDWALWSRAGKAGAYVRMTA